MAHKHTTVGHIHLTVADLDRSLTFYHDFLGFDISARYGESAVFLSAGGYHHHIGLNTWSGTNATPPPKGHTGLYHVAFLFPSRYELALVLKRLIDANYPLDGSADHGVSEAIYLRDPDDNGVELYIDRPHDQWTFNSEGMIEMISEPLNVRHLLDELS